MGNSHIRQIKISSNNRSVSLITEDGKTYFTPERFPIHDHVNLTIELNQSHGCLCTRYYDVIELNYQCYANVSKTWYQLDKGIIYLDYDTIANELIFHSYIHCRK